MQIALAGGEPDFEDGEEEEVMRMAASKNNDDAQDQARDIVGEVLKKKQAEASRGQS